ncbi:3D (Asp-Asp-Asp) domain-containing protein/LysM repeat protein [Bacillus ectoiniformans]|uniref:3D domain-containing protein n=1 Tax=Bacillus ectoiniformans TaxID=1494429 RepID=UPI0019560043|nr:3D domain-containing protein [Bacillus ectoiniformans]MBM7649318.1 3D (Asp-Asp-Asp) domain-containing protein/LysM repeat protein [Bacillus ectoiniformans]
MKKQIIALAATTVIGGGLFGTAASASTYTVQKGDTLWAISQNNNTTVDALKNANELTSDLIFPKQQLQLSGESAAPAKQDKKYHIVKPGDTLYNIATTNGLSVSALKAMNGLSSDLILPGTELTLNGPVKGVTETKEAAAPKAEAPAPAPKQEAPKAEAPAQAEGKTISVKATAYTADCQGCSGITATGIDVKNNRNAKVIAVDPNVIPLGSKVYVEGYGEAIAGDTGGAIKGNRIDLHVPTNSEAMAWGVKTVDVTILD